MLKIKVKKNPPYLQYEGFSIKENKKMKEKVSMLNTEIISVEQPGFNKCLWMLIAYIQPPGEHSVIIS